MGYGSNPTEDQWRENLTKSFGADKAVALDNPALFPDLFRSDARLRAAIFAAKL